MTTLELIADDIFLTIYDGKPIKLKIEGNIMDMGNYGNEVLLLVNEEGKIVLKKVKDIDDIRDEGLAKTYALPRVYGSRRFRVEGEVLVYEFSDGSRMIARGSINPNDLTVSTQKSDVKIVTTDGRVINMPNHNIYEMNLCNDYIAATTFTNMVMFKVENGKVIKLGSEPVMTKTWTFSPNCDFFAVANVNKVILFKTENFKKFMEIYPEMRYTIHKVAWTDKALWLAVRDKTENVVEKVDVILAYEYLAATPAPPPDQ